MSSLEEVILENTTERLRAHPESKCDGEICCIHNRTDHCMREFPQHWRSDRGIMERICPCGIGHPDPDDRMNTDTIHGCCGKCCIPEGEEKVVEIDWAALKEELQGARTEDKTSWGQERDPHQRIKELQISLDAALARERTKKETIRRLEQDVAVLKEAALMDAKRRIQARTGKLLQESVTFRDVELAVSALERRVTELEEQLSEMPKLPQTWKDVDGRACCPRCGGTSDLGFVCTACVREEEYES